MPRTASAPAAGSPARQLAAFLQKYTPDIVGFATAARTRLRRQIPGGVEFVYDNYSALVIGYGPTEWPSDAVLSLALYPRHVTLCFLKGARLPDPAKILRGAGSTVRNVRLTSPAHLDEPPLRNLIRLAVAAAEPPFPGGRLRTIIRSVSARQRPRRPA